MLVRYDIYLMYTNLFIYNKEKYFYQSKVVQKNINAVVELLAMCRKFNNNFLKAFYLYLMIIGTFLE